MLTAAREDEVRRCGGRLKVIASLSERALIERILAIRSIPRTGAVSRGRSNLLSAPKQGRGADPADLGQVANAAVNDTRAQLD